MQQIRFGSCEDLAHEEADLCLASDGGLTEYGARLVAYGRWLDKVVKRGDITTLYEAQRRTNTGAEDRLVAHAFVLHADRNFMWAERRAAAAYGRAIELGLLK